MIRRAVPLLLALALAACGGGTSDNAVASLDDELAAGANGQDPLLAAVVQDPIMTDPQLSTRSNADAIRPPAQPYAAMIPATDVVPFADADDGALTKVPDPAPGDCRECAVARDAITLGALAARQDDARMKSCGPSLRYAAGWANRLPADLPLYRSARVIEAAGADGAGCALRAVTFATTHPVGHMLDWYFTRASAGGFRSAHAADDAVHVLSGTRSRDGATFVAVIRAGANGGSEVDLLTSAAR